MEALIQALNETLSLEEIQLNDKELSGPTDRKIKGENRLVNLRRS